MTQTSCSVRAARPEDAAEFVAIVRRGFEETRAFETPSSALFETEADVRTALQVDAGLLATLRGVPSGCLRLRVSEGGKKLQDVKLGAPRSVSPRPGLRVQFSRLAVVPEARRQGVATALLDAVYAYAYAIGAESVDITVRSQQPDNRPLWIRRGFNVIGYSERYGISDMVTHMRRNLSYGAEPER